MIEGQKCGDCIHFLPNEKDESLGACRRNPPQIVLAQGVTSGYNPVTKELVQGQKVTVPKPMFPGMATGDPGCGEFCDKNKVGIDEQLGKLADAIISSSLP